MPTAFQPASELAEAAARSTVNVTGTVYDFDAPAASSSPGIVAVGVAAFFTAKPAGRASEMLSVRSSNAPATLLVFVTVTL